MNIESKEWIYQWKYVFFFFKCDKFRKFVDPKISYIFNKTIFLSIFGTDVVIIMV